MTEYLPFEHGRGFFQQKLYFLAESQSALFHIMECVVALYLPNVQSPSVEGEFYAKQLIQS